MDHVLIGGHKHHGELPLLFMHDALSCLMIERESAVWKKFLNYGNLFPRNSKIITVLSSSLLKCDKSTLKLPLS